MYDIVFLNLMLNQNMLVNKLYLVLLVFFLGVTQLQAKSVEDAELDLLKGRVESRWAVIADHKFDDVYDFETPAYKAVFPKSFFVNMFSYGVDWQFEKIDKVSFDSEAGVATVVVSIKTSSANTRLVPKDMSVIPVKFNEKWLHIDGVWWHSSTE